MPAWTVSSLLQEAMETAETAQFEAGTVLSAEDQSVLAGIQKLHEENPEVIGWIQFDNMDISYPVMQAKDNDYYLTYKSKGLMAREEYDLPLNKSAYEHLLEKADGNILTKTRYEIPLGDHLIIELDIFHGKFDGLVLAEVEFPSLEEAENFMPPEYFGEDVTFSSEYHNSTLSQK